MTATVTQLPNDSTGELEVALLGAFLLNTSKSDRTEAVATVQPRHFVGGKNRTLWEVLSHLHRDDQPVDATVIFDELTRRGWVEAAGGYGYLSDVVSAAVSGASLAEYARRLVGHAQRRAASIEAGSLAQALSDPSVDAAEQVYAAVERLMSAVNDGEAGAIRVRDLYDDIRQLRDDGPFEGFRCGVRELDRRYRPGFGQLSVITGMPSSGKSTWLAWYLTQMAHRHDWRVAVFTPESRPYHKWASRLIGASVGQPIEQMSDDRLRNAVGWVDDHFELINDLADAKLSGILANARLIHERRPLNGIVIDPWNWVESARPNGMPATEYIGLALNEVVRFAVRYDLHVWVVAHPTKMRRVESGEKAGSYVVPGPYDISDSSNWFNKPWWNLTVWRDHLMPQFGEEGYDSNRDPFDVEVHVQKARDDDMGRPGVAALRYQPMTRRYGEPARQAP